MPFVFFNGLGQGFIIEGLNDQMAYDDAVAHIAAGRPFGRWNMKRLENTYGVKVSFYREEEGEDFTAFLIHTCMEDHGY